MKMRVAKEVETEVVGIYLDSAASFEIYPLNDRENQAKKFGVGLISNPSGRE